ncbi:hypothetical protein HMPREF1221_00022 [Treponema socranskii subsp. paredis ATCC 35535]|nr:hypothetical protein HMPREF1221_00022 [Treponema socranskii subsp. paredis ATCC 35535]
MNSFSKKTDVTLLIVSTAAFIVSVVMIICSTQLFVFIQTVVETKLLHRTLNPKTLNQIFMSLIAFPIFFTILFDGLFFVKFSKQSKIILLLQFFIAAAVLTSVCAFTRCIQYMNSDMASEIMLAKECFTHKTFWPRSWYYSTEFRLLNTQLVAAPLFAFTSNWITVKAVSVIILCFALPLSLWFLLETLDVKTAWIKLLCALLVFVPWSGQMWELVQFGNYYIPHIVISFIYIGLFISLAYKELSAQKRKIFSLIFFALAFISGISGIRYILNFQLPIALTLIILAVHHIVVQKERFDFSCFFIRNKRVFYASANIILGGVGYAMNSLILHRLFLFSTWNDIRFNTLGDITFSDVHRAVFEIFGYHNKVLALGPAGINNVMLYIASIFFIICFVLCVKKYEAEHKQIFLIITIVMIILNFFVIIHTEFAGRYFVPSLVYCIPCFALFLENKTLSSWKKYCVGVAVSITLIAASFITYIDVLTYDGNRDKIAVCQFLNKNYTFGYATFWNANIFTFMTDGRIEISNLETDVIDNVDYIPSSFRYYFWLTSDRFYRDDYKASEPVFFLVTQKEYNDSPGHKAFKTGRQVYSDDFYRVFEFENKKAFIDGF